MIPQITDDAKPPRGYRRLYFLYVWAEPRNDPGLSPLWRYRVEDAATREQHAFSQLSALEEFLRAQEARSRNETIQGG